MIIKTPRGYLFEMNCSNKEQLIFEESDFVIHESMSDFIKYEREFLDAGFPAFDPIRDEITAYYICDDRTGWRCDRGILNRFENPFKITDPEMQVFFFLLNFEM